MGRTNVSADSTAMMSEICATSSSAAMRGATSLPNPVAGSSRWVYAGARPTTSVARFSAVGLAYWGASACSALVTPPTCAAACATGPALWPATRTSIGPPILRAAAMVLRVALLSALPSCSAMTRIMRPALRNDLRFVAQLGDQLLGVGDPTAALAFRRLDHLEGRQARCDVGAERVGPDD